MVLDGSSFLVGHLRSMLRNQGEALDLSARRRLQFHLLQSGLFNPLCRLPTCYFLAFFSFNPSSFCCSCRTYRLCMGTCSLLMYLFNRPAGPCSLLMERAEFSFLAVLRCLDRSRLRGLQRGWGWVLMEGEVARMLVGSCML